MRFPSLHTCARTQGKYTTSYYTTTTTTTYNNKNIIIVKNIYHYSQTIA